MAPVIAKIGYAVVKIFTATLPAYEAALAIGGAVVVAGGVAAKKVMSLFEVEMPKIDTDRSRQATVRSTTEPYKIVYGQALVSGPIAFTGVAGTDNEDLYYAIALAGHEVTNITDIHFDNEVIASGNIDSNGYVTSGTFFVTGQTGSNSICTIKKYLGTSTQTADSLLTGAFPSTWTSNHTGKGIAYIVTKWRLNEDSQEVWDKYTPNDIKALVQGKKLYDPRLDSTQIEISGSGSHRIYDPSTWTYSTNPALCLLDYLINVDIKDAGTFVVGVDYKIEYVGDTDFTAIGASSTPTVGEVFTATGAGSGTGKASIPHYGMGINSSKIDWSAVVTAANGCDASVSVPGGSETRFTCNGVLFGTDSHRTNINKILSSMNGMLSYVNGKYVMRAGIYEAPAIDSILNEDDLIGAISIKTSLERGDRFNTVKGLFIDPNQNHKNSEFPLVQLTDAVNRDNQEVLEKEVQFPMTNSSYMAQRLANKLIQLSDQQKVITFPANLSAMRVAVGDRVKVSIEELNWSNKIFQCLGWSFSEEGGVNLTLREDSSTSYADPAVGDYSTITATGDITPGFRGVPGPSGLSATAGLKNVELHWVNPANNKDFETIFVYAAPESATPGQADFVDAVKIGETDGTQFIHDASNPVDSVAVGDLRYYWVRAVRYKGTSNQAVSPTHPDSGTPNSTVYAEVGRVEWSDVSGSTGAPEDNATVGATIGTDLYDIDDTTVMGTTDVKNQVTVNIEDENNVILETELGDRLLIQTSGDVGLYTYTEVTSLGAQYSIKIDNAGRVAGFGLSSTLPTDTTDPAFSEFTVLADKFQIVDPASPSNDPFIPFVVTADKIEMNTDVRISGDLVTLGTISAERLKIDNITLDTDGSGNLIIKNNGVTSLQIAASAVGNTQLAGDAVSKDKFQDNVNPVELGATLPVTATQGDMFFLTTDNNLYRYDGAAWTKAITLTEVSDAGTLAGLNDITLSYVTDAGILAGLNDINLSYVTDAGALAALNDIDLSKVTDAGALAALSGIDLSYVSDAGDLASLNVITSDYIAANAVIAGKIAAGAITTDKLAASSVTASKIAVVGRGAALNSDPNCTDSEAWTLRAGNAGTFETITDGIVGNNVLRSGSAGASGSQYINDFVALDANKTYRMTVVARKSGTADGVLYLGVAAFEADGTSIQGPSAGTYWSYGAADNESGSTTFTRYTMEFGSGTANTFPSNAVTFSPILILNFGSTAGYFEVQDVRIEEKIPASLIVDGTITADQIQANTITSAELAAGSITASKLAIVGGGAALNSDPNCTDSAAWTQFAGYPGTFTTITDGVVGNNVIRSGTPTSQGSWYNGNRVALDPNKTYRMTVVARKDSAADGTFYAGVAAFQGDGTNIGGDGTQWSYGAAGGIAGSTSFTRYTMEFGAGTSYTFPANAVTFAPLVILNYNSTAGYFEAQDIRIEEKVPASLIVDGTITADQIASNTITAAQIAASTITTSEIAANTIVAGNIAAGAIGATEISVTNLAAISADLGTVTAGSLDSDLITGDVNETFALSYRPLPSVSIGSTASTLLSPVIPAPQTIKRNLVTADLQFEVSRSTGGNDEVGVGARLYRRSKGESAFLIGEVAVAGTPANGNQQIKISGDVTNLIGSYGACDSNAAGTSGIDYRYIYSVYFDGNYTILDLHTVAGTDTWTVGDDVYYSADAFFSSLIWVSWGYRQQSAYVIAGGNTQHIIIPVTMYFGATTTVTELRFDADVYTGSSNSTVNFTDLSGYLGNVK